MLLSAGDIQLEMIKKILKHLGLWDVTLKPPLYASGPLSGTAVVNSDDYCLH
jgi:hypothetical protein